MWLQPKNYAHKQAKNFRKFGCKLNKQLPKSVGKQYLDIDLIFF